MEFICYFDIRTFVDDYLLIWEPYWLLKERVYLIQYVLSDGRIIGVRKTQVHYFRITQLILFFSMCVFIFQEGKAPRTYVKWVFLESYLYEKRQKVHNFAILLELWNPWNCLPLYGHLFTLDVFGAFLLFSVRCCLYSISERCFFFIDWKRETVMN